MNSVLGVKRLYTNVSIEISSANCMVLGETQILAKWDPLDQKMILGISDGFAIKIL